MKRKLALSITSLLLIVLLTGCGNTNTKEKKIVPANKTENTKQDKPTVTFLLDGRLIEAAEYYCGWKLTEKENMLTLSIVYDREPKTNPPNLGFAIYNLKDISMPFNRLNGKLPGKSEQFFSLSAGLGLPKGKAADMNELSFSDNYTGLESLVLLSLLDTTAKIVSGRFEGTIKNANGKTMNITEGKFERIPLKMVYSDKIY
jgi:hypothetical protein